MARSAAIALTDILEAIDLAREAAFDLSNAAFEQDRIRRAAIERALLTISEAVRHLPDDMLERHPDLRWNDMRAPLPASLTLHGERESRHLRGIAVIASPSSANPYGSSSLNWRLSCSVSRMRE